MERETEQPEVLVVGAGSWGTALANLLAGKGVSTTIWAREPEVVEAIVSTRENVTFLPGVPLSDELRASSDLSDELSKADIVVSAVPTQFKRELWSEVASQVAPSKPIITVSKGIEVDRLLTPAAILEQVLGRQISDRLVALSGPSFAREVVARHPTAVVAASENEELAQHVQRLFSTELFRVYTSPDVIGVELGGALKNVIAIASGIVEGLGFGHNTTAALITRGIAEITRLGVAMGGDPFTFAGLSGMGDLVLTCTGGLSRNRSVGVELGRGRPLEEIVAEMHMVAEGVKTTEAVRQLSESVGVEMPICDQVYEVLYEGKSPSTVGRELMVRDLKAERDG